MTSLEEKTRKRKKTRREVITVDGKSVVFLMFSVCLVEVCLVDVFHY